MPTSTAQPGLVARLSQWSLALFFVLAGTLHFLFTAHYVAIMPPWLPAQHALVIVSGLFEIAGGVGLLINPCRRQAGLGLIALCLAVLPANVQMLLNAQADNASTGWLALLWLRLPLQGLLIVWIWRVSQRD